MTQIQKRFIPAGTGIRCKKVYSKLTPKGVCWHYTGNFAPTANAENHWKLWHRVDVGAHYVVDKNQIIWCAPHEEVIWHAGPGKDYTSYIKQKYPGGANSNLIGVELCICDGWPAIYNNAITLAVALCKQYGWDPYKNFERHYDCTRKQCPMHWADSYKGGNAAWKKFLADVDAALKRESQPPYDGPFSDMQGHWAEGVVNELHKLGLVSGANGMFSPNVQCNRAEVAAMIVRAANRIGLKEDRPPKKFADVPHPKCTWATDSILKASALGLIGGYPDGTFKPMNSITRAEFAVITGNLLTRCGTSLPKASNIFSDTTNLWEGADAIICGLAELGILSKGKEFYPKRPLTRAELAAVLYRVMVHFGIIKPK